MKFRKLTFKFSQTLMLSLHYLEELTSGESGVAVQENLRPNILPRLFCGDQCVLLVTQSFSHCWWSNLCYSKSASILLTEKSDYVRGVDGCDDMPAVVIS